MPYIIYNKYVCLTQLATNLYVWHIRHESVWLEQLTTDLYAWSHLLHIFIFEAIFHISSPCPCQCHSGTSTSAGNKDWMWKYYKLPTSHPNSPMFIFVWFTWNTGTRLLRPIIPPARSLPPLPHSRLSCSLISYLKINGWVSYYIVKKYIKILYHYL